MGISGVADYFDCIQKQHQFFSLQKQLEDVVTILVTFYINGNRIQICLRLAVHKAIPTLDICHPIFSTTNSFWKHSILIHPQYPHHTTSSQHKPIHLGISIHHQREISLNTQQHLQCHSPFSCLLTRSANKQQQDL